MADYLISSNQSPELLTAFRSAYSQPNVRLMVARRSSPRYWSTSQSTHPVDECVLGTRVLGNSIINGSVFADLVPQHNGVGLQLTLNGFIRQQQHWLQSRSQGLHDWILTGLCLEADYDYSARHNDLSLQWPVPICKPPSTRSNIA